MGIYYESTTGKEDTEFILNGIKHGKITTDFYWPPSDEDKAEKYLVWISLDDHRQHLIHKDYDSFGEIITINGIKGRLTIHGCDYISMCLRLASRFGTTL
jgi:hypothetical protein